jgi:repressor LexA
MTDFEKLPEQLQGILDFIRAYIRENGYAPSVREIGSAMGIPSTSTVHGLLKRLEETGFLRRDPAKPRAMVVTMDASADSLGDRVPEGSFSPVTGQSEKPFLIADFHSLPFVLFDEVSDEKLSSVELAEAPLAQQWMIPGSTLEKGAYFMTAMPDDSMANSQINTGDLLIVRIQPTANNGDFILCRVDDETLVRTYYQGIRQIRLQPESGDLEALMIDQDKLAIYGVVAGVVRLLS